MALTQTATDGIKDDAVTLDKFTHGDSNNNGKFLRANNGAAPSFESIPAGITINNQADNRVLTATGTTDTLNGEANLIFDGSRLGINNPTFGNYNADCDDFIIQGSGSTGITINSGGTGNSFTGNIAFAEGNGTGGSADAFRGAISYKHDDDHMTFYTNYTEGLRIGSTGKISTGAETAPDVGAGGLCIQKNTDSNKALTIKNTNVAHGVTTYDETDTFFSIGQSSGNKGGVEIRGYTDAASADPGIRLRGIIASDSDHTYTPLVFIGAEANGTGVQNIAADRRIATFQNSDGARIVNITGTGISFGDNHAANHALDDYDEGTYTPVVGAAGWNATSNEADGTYIKVGNIVTVHIRYESNSFSSVGMSDYLYVTLPFTAKSGGSTKGTLAISEWSIGSQNISWIGADVGAGDAYALFKYHNGSNNNTNNLTKTNANNQLNFKGTVVFQTA